MVRGLMLKCLTRKNKADMILGFSSVGAQAAFPLDADESDGPLSG